jgi:tRNA (guanine-N(7)-)-methyltransferase subunit TRM82
MIKRPSALALAGDSIFCADKSGDVYSLPLLPTKEEDDAARGAALESALKSFAPAATNLTVHSKSNLRSLELQKKQLENKPVEKTEQMTFAHRLLLGHVSMTTAILAPEVTTQEGRKRRYILTSDRDEHIRVSRSPPQAHVIENYCFGHKEFVNSLCLATPKRLISGGGDNYLFVWDWQNGILASKVSLESEVAKTLKNGPAQVAVSGIWRLGSGDNEEVREIPASKLILTDTRPGCSLRVKLCRRCSIAELPT